MDGNDGKKEEDGAISILKEKRQKSKIPPVSQERTATWNGLGSLRTTGGDAVSHYGPLGK